jgi:type I restriction enzyme, S subunit
VSEGHRNHLPGGWQTTTLDEVILLNPRLDKSEVADDTEVSFVPMSAVEAESGRIDVTTSRQFHEVKKGYTPFREGDVLFAKITPCMENGKMAVVPPLTGGIGFGSTEFHVLRPRSGINPRFLYHFVSSRRFRVDAEHNMTGAVGQRRVPAPYLAACEFLLPPLNEQRRIVAKLEELFSELDAGVESLKTAREQLKVYRQALLKHAFEGKLTAEWRGENADESQSWRTVTLGDLFSFVTSGSRGWAKYYAERGDKFIRAQNLKHDRLNLEDIAYVSLPDQSEGMRTRVQVGDILVTITGANVTKTGLVASDVGAAYVSQHVALCRPVEEVLPEFLYWFLVADAAGAGRRQLNEFAYGAGKPGLNLDNIRAVTLELPSPNEQHQIVRQLNSALITEERLRATIDDELMRSEALRQSILKRAFSGRLVPQDPSDEPASALLERIRTEKAVAGNDKPRRRARRR